MKEVHWIRQSFFIFYKILLTTSCALSFWAILWYDSSVNIEQLEEDL